MGAAQLKSGSPATALQAKVDRCGYLIAQKRECKPWLDELETLRGELQAQCDDRPGQAVRLKGTQYYVDLGPREWRRAITDQRKCWNALKAAIGIEKLVERVTIAFKVIDTAIPKEKQAAFVVAERSGPRDMTAGLLKSPLAAA